MVQIAMDLGNSRLKTGIFLNNKLIKVLKLGHEVLAEGGARAELQVFFSEAAEMNENTATRIPVMFSSVMGPQNVLLDWLKQISELHVLDHQTALPFINCYQSPASLGSDRLAAVAGAMELFPQQNILIVNAGTAITYECINEHGQYLGGAISPGVQMRYKALHTFTSRLPLVEINENIPELTGKDTVSAIRSGVELGALFEIQQAIESYLRIYGPGMRVCLCGGDSKTFVSRMKSSIFADQLVWQPDLVLIGLNKILTFNNA